ncbi:MAG: glycosyltransferase [Desulfuromonadales bacterium]|nr:glycosyltransferase [Desulfuromonadales bacterium]MBN2791301.1 glycosyltransferase [Desulfuromonadales bacterium]
MKIALFITSTGHGGAEKFFLELCNELSKKHEITVMTYKNPYILDNLKNHIGKIVIPKRSRRNPMSYFDVYKHLKKNNFEIIHTHSAKAAEITYRILKFIPLCQVATKHNSRKGKVFDRIKYVTAVSSNVAKTIKKESSVIFNGIKVKKINPSQPADGRFRILAIGRLDPVKGFDVLIDQVSTLDIDYKLDIVGEGPQRALLEKKIGDLSLAGKVKLLGFCDNVHDLMNESDLVVISSHTEGFSLVTIESLFYANILISTPVSGSVEILPESLIVEQENIAKKILEIHENKQDYVEIFKSVSNSCRGQFDIKTCSDEYSKFYQNVYNQFESRDR